MPHVLSRIRNVNFEEVRNMLRQHAPMHAKEGLYIEKVWVNAEDTNEVLFLFRTDDLNHAREFIQRTHQQALRENPHVNLPHTTYLAD